MTQVGTGYVDIKPSFDGFQQELAQRFQRVGQQASQDFSDAFRDHARQQGEDISRIYGDALGQNARRAGQEAGEDFNRGVQAEAQAGGGKLKATMGKIGKAAGAALIAGAGGLGAAIGKALEKEGLNAKLAAQLDLSTGTAGRAGKLAGRIYAGNYGESLGEVNDAIRALAQNTGVSLDGGNIERFSAKLLNLSSAFGTDADEVTRSINSLVSNGLAPNIDAAFDLVTRGFQKGADRGGEFLDTLNEYADPVRQLGVTAGDFTSSISRGFDAGVFSADKLGDAIKEFSIRAIDDSDTTKFAFETLGLPLREYKTRLAEGGPVARKAFAEVITGIQSIRDPLLQESVGVSLFGAQFEDIGLKGISALKPIEGGLDGVRGAADRMDKTLGQTSGATLEAFKRKASLAFADAGAAAIRAGQDLREKLEPTVRRIAASIGRFFSENREDIRQLGQAFRNVFAGVSAVVRRALPAIRSALGGIVTAARGVIRIFSGIFTGDLDKVMDGVKDIVLGPLRALRAAIRLQTEPLRAAGRAIGNGIKAGIRGGLSGLASIGKTVVNELIGILNTGFQAVNDFLPNSLSSGIPGAPKLNLPDNPLPTIKPLALGGVVTAPTFAMLGEAGDDEAVVPLNRPTLARLGAAIAVELGRAPAARPTAAAAAGGRAAPITINQTIVAPEPRLSAAQATRQMLTALNREMGRRP